MVFVARLEGGHSDFNRGQQWRAAGGKCLTTQDGQVDFDRIEPTGLHRTMDGNQPRIFFLWSDNAFGATMGGSVAHDPEHVAGLVVRWLAHDLVDQPVKWCDALGLATAEQLGMMRSERGHTGPCAALRVYMRNTY